jgi:hypothetical protein
VNIGGATLFWVHLLGTGAVMFGALALLGGETDWPKAAIIAVSFLVTLLYYFGSILFLRRLARYFGRPIEEEYED